HGRTRSQGYNGVADWDYIAGVKRNSPLPIIGNGDITSAEIAVNRLKETGCDGVMIGRGCLKNPWIFHQAMEKFMGDKVSVISHQYMGLFNYLKEEGEKYYDEKYLMLQLRKLGAWYSA